MKYIAAWCKFNNSPSNVNLVTGRFYMYRKESRKESPGE
jgi:hypothetical protein